MFTHRQFPALTLLLLAALALLSGFLGSRAPAPAPAELPEPSLSQQVQAVRDGTSTRLRLDRALVRDDDLVLLDGLEDKLTAINFSRSEIGGVGMARIGRMSRLEQLRIASQWIDDAALASLRELKHLRFLHLIDTPITDAGLDQLHALTTLESLYLDGTDATDAGIGRLLAAMPGLHLHVDDHHHPLDSHARDHEHDNKAHR